MILIKTKAVTLLHNLHLSKRIFTNLFVIMKAGWQVLTMVKSSCRT